jgi:acyl-lipid omega-6 desaturase (Delta-12 desaturase)
MDKVDYHKIQSKLNFKIEPLRCALHVLIDSLLIAIVYFCAKEGRWVAVGAPIALAIVYFRAFAAMHDAVHGVLHPNRKVNRWLGTFYAGLCFLPFLEWRKGHLDHHQWAGNIDQDPVMKLCRHVKAGGQLHSAIELGWRYWFPVLAILQHKLFWSEAAKLAFAKNTLWRDRVRVSSVPAAWVLLLVLLGVEFSVAVFLPSVMLYLMLGEAVNFPHHLELPQSGGDKRLSPREQHEISRSCTYFVLFERLVLLNFNYHVEHHMFPTLPWHQLPRAFFENQIALRESHNSEHGFKWVFRNRRRLLRDVLYSQSSQDQLIGKAS